MAPEEIQAGRVYQGADGLLREVVKVSEASDGLLVHCRVVGGEHQVSLWSMAAFIEWATRELSIDLQGWSWNFSSWEPGDRLFVQVVGDDRWLEAVYLGAPKGTVVRIDRQVFAIDDGESWKIVMARTISAIRSFRRSTS